MVLTFLPSGPHFTVLPPLPIVWASGDIVGTWTLLYTWHTRQRAVKGSGGRDDLVVTVSSLTHTSSTSALCTSVGMGA